MSDNLPAIQNTSIAEVRPVSIQDMKQQVQAIQQAMKDVMERDVHYGVIPGTDKPALLKAGAEKIGLLFRLAPTFAEEVLDRGNGHREVRVKCTLTHPTGVVVSQGLGVCSTLESKYRWRKGQRKCPNCGSEAIIKGKKEYGGGWLCWGKKGGCDAKFPDGDRSIEEQSVDRVENPDIADAWNTVLKMAKKRAHVDAVITGTAASDIFAQDIEEQQPEGEPQPQKKADAAVSQQRPASASAQSAQRPAQGYGTGNGPIDWSALPFRYHLPVKKEGKDMDAVRAWLKKQGFKFNPDDKHWYGPVAVERIAEYLRPLEPTHPSDGAEPEVLPAEDDGGFGGYPDYDDSNDEPEMPNI